MKLDLHRPHQETLEKPFDYSRLDKVGFLSLEIERGANLDLLPYILHVVEINFIPCEQPHSDCGCQVIRQLQK